MRTLRARCLAVAAVLGALAWSHAAQARGVPDWVRDQATAPLPAYDDETDAVLLYSETSLRVKAVGKVERTERRVYRILRRGGEDLGLVRIDFDSQTPVKRLQGWSIATDGEEYETRRQDLIEASLQDVENGLLLSDVRTLVLSIPAATPGSIVAYEVEQAGYPYVLTDEWTFQEPVPVRATHYSLQLPEGWTYQATWIHHPEAPASSGAQGETRWALRDIPPVAIEKYMPPWRGIAGRMAIAIQPPGGARGGFLTWQDLGAWYLDLARGRRDLTPEIRAKARALTAPETTALGKIRALASFVQSEIRYVAIELGIGGYQPHPAADVLQNLFGDCKDKATLLSALLSEIGIDSHYVLVNTTRGAVTAATPPSLDFNHVILAIELPEGAEELPAARTHATLGNLLYFDPTHRLIPPGSLAGFLQAGFGVLVTPAGGELLELPRLPAEASGLRRHAELTLDEAGTLHGRVEETWLGDSAATQREQFRAAVREEERIKPVEMRLSHALSQFTIERASVSNAQRNEAPLVWRYEFHSTHYAKRAGDLWLVRPRVFGTYAGVRLDDEKPRVHPIELGAAESNRESFSIALPPGFVAEELPDPVKIDLGFASYRSAVESRGGTLHYTRSLAFEELEVPAAQAKELDRLFRAIEADERQSVVVRRIAP